MHNDTNNENASEVFVPGILIIFSYPYLLF